jgi:hypothetical protein
MVNTLDSFICKVARLLIRKMLQERKPEKQFPEVLVVGLLFEA